MGRFSMSRGNLALTALSLILIFFIGIAAAQCRRGHTPETSEIIFGDSDSTTVKQDNAQQVDSLKRKKKRIKKNVKKKSRPKPVSREYLNERVN